MVHVTSDGNDRMIPLLSLNGGAYLKANRWYSAAQQGLVATRILRNKIEKGAPPTAANIALPGWTVEPGTTSPVIVNTRQSIETAKNATGLPAFGYPQFDRQISFGG
jgi:hypothetical protein